MLMYRPLKELAHTGQQVVQGQAGAQRIFEVLDAPDALPEPASPETAAFESSIEVRDILFSYDGTAEHSILKNLSLKIPKGSSLAVVGGSGSGKSTLAALLLRFYDPVSGGIFLDGRDIRAFWTGLPA